MGREAISVVTIITTSLLPFQRRGTWSSEVSHFALDSLLSHSISSVCLHVWLTSLWPQTKYAWPCLTCVGMQTSIIPAALSHNPELREQVLHTAPVYSQPEKKCMAVYRKDWGLPPPVPRQALWEWPQPRERGEGGAGGNHKISLSDVRGDGSRARHK